MNGGNYYLRRGIVYRNLAFRRNVSCKKKNPRSVSTIAKFTAEQIKLNRNNLGYISHVSLASGWEINFTRLLNIFFIFE